MADELANRYRMPVLANPGPDEFRYILYNYVPNLGFNAFAATAYGLVMLAHAFWFVKHRRTRWIQAHMVVFCVSHDPLGVLQHVKGGAYCAGL